VIAWTLHDNKDKLNDRLYAFNIAIGKSAGDVLDRLSNELGVALTQSEDEDDDDFSVDIEGSASETPYQPLTDLLRSSAAGDEAIERLIDISRGVVEEDRGKRTGGAALKSVGVANARLAEVDIGRADPNTLNSIARQLEQIVKRAEELQATTNELIEAEKKKADSRTSSDKAS
jgi:hypothetical protein